MSRFHFIQLYCEDPLTSQARPEVATFLVNLDHIAMAWGTEYGTVLRIVVNGTAYNEYSPVPFDELSYEILSTQGLDIKIPTV